MTGAMINHLWQSTLFCAAVWLITLALRSNGAAIRHWLWLIASLKFLVPFSVLYYLGGMAGLLALEGAQPSLLSEAVAVASPVISPTESFILIAPTPASGWGLLLAMVWATGAAILALRWFHAWRAADSITRAARPVPGSLLDARVTDVAIEPAVARVFHPVVLLPSALLGRLSTEQLGAVLAHEREHIARHDNLTAHLHHLVQTLFWFHPLVWWIGRQMLEERERACDEAVIENGHDAQQYAEGILAVCRHCHELQHAGGTASAIAGDLTERIRAIIRHVPPASLGFCKAFALSACTLALGLAPLLAGATDDATRRHEQLMNDSRNLWRATVYVSPSDGGTGDHRLQIHARQRAVIVRNATLRELVALSYGVPLTNINGGPWLDTTRYDFRAELRDPVIDPDHFDPSALRGVVNKLLASRFDLQVHVNQRCQDPCGKYEPGNALL